jgi:hypothetical protein
MPEPTESEAERVSSAADGPVTQSSIVDDLERRIDELEQMAEDQFGRFTTLDWFLCVAGSLLLPYLVYLWYWP